MPKFKLFMFEDRDQANGEYIGRTLEYTVEAPNCDYAIGLGYKQNGWARGCFCEEIEIEE